MSLSDVAIRRAKSEPKPYKLSDGDGLFLLVQPNGAKWWRFKYYFEGKEKSLSLGVYPDVGLADARERRSESRKQLAHGQNARLFTGQIDGVVCPVHVLSFKAGNVALARSQMPAKLIKQFTLGVHFGGNHIGAMFYRYAPLCKIAPTSDRNEAIKILGRGFRDQFNNLADERYVQSALLCDRLLTRDKGMHNVMALFKDCGFWDGVSIFIDPKKDMEFQISQNLI